ncbi:uncharacterized protein N7482_010285 [Penicillium canariense]|uniref:MOSC domain-containing protein n=1 Tax=Penicillium canariense TaxID=189055 RepID=A0A9W9HLP4_9EURO|nr:uncharacterized protein N7482_010285 [Penicillium canariense]KAJ5151033.1 hypothetical protein N7482_010285 [Penicillium canariense]
MHIPHFPEMALFQTDIEIPGNQNQQGKVIVTYNPPSLTDTNPNTAIGVEGAGDIPPLQKPKRLEIPLQPDTKHLKRFTVTMHQSPTKGYDMGAAYNDWFSACFGYRVVLAYLGTNTRSVLGTLAPSKRNNESWWSIWQQELTLPGKSNKLLDRWLVPLSLAYLVLNAVSWCHAQIQAGTSAVQAIALTGAVLAALWSAVNLFVTRRHEARIGFADCAPFLVISQTSVENVSARLTGGEEMDGTKFRPNIVVSGVESAFEEDFWAELGVGTGGNVRLLLTGNCVRCQSLNVDFQTGKMGVGESGTVLKKLMKDRRVDKGARFSPVFGRYSFLGRGSVGQRMRVGDEVQVLRRASEYTVTGEVDLRSLLVLGLS